MGDNDSEYRPQPDWIGRSLLFMLAAFAILALGAATIGAAVAPIPIVGLIGLVLFPFPSLLLYTGAATLLYFLAITPLRLASVDRSWHRMTMLAVAIALPVVAGYLYADAMNRRAGVSAPLVSPGWAPLRLTGRQYALVSTGEYTPKPACDAFCLSLLVAGNASEIVVASSNANVDRGMRLTGIAFALKPDWRACLGRLPDYVMGIREEPEYRRSDMIDLGLNPDFEPLLPQCLTQRPVQFVAGALPTLVKWQSAAETGDARDAGIGWQPPYAEQRIFLPGGDNANRRALRFGNRYAMPAMIWPYGGNAGSGGTFSPRLMQVFLSTDSIGSLDGPVWWDMVADGNGLASRAMAVLDTVVPDRFCHPEPNAADCGGGDETEIVTTDGFDNRSDRP